MIEKVRSIAMALDLLGKCGKAPIAAAYTGDDAMRQGFPDFKPPRCRRETEPTVNGGGPQGSPPNVQNRDGESSWNFVGAIVNLKDRPPD
jgi:hypothetical protein